MKSLIFKKIIIPSPKQKIYRRLGFLDSRTLISLKQKERIEQYIQDGLSLINLKGIGLRLEIKKKNPEKIVLPGKAIFKSKNLGAMLKDACEVLLMAATSGSRIMKAIKQDIAGKNITRAVILDAVASEMTDASLDWIMQYFNQGLRRENKYLTRKRYSCGYGDLPLKNQKIIYRLLDLRGIGIKITKDFMLVPEKSVTAIAGVIEK